MQQCTNILQHKIKRRKHWSERGCVHHGWMFTRYITSEKLNILKGTTHKACLLFVPCLISAKARSLSGLSILCWLGPNWTWQNVSIPPGFVKTEQHFFLCFRIPLARNNNTVVAYLLPGWKMAQRWQQWTGWRRQVHSWVSEISWMELTRPRHFRLFGSLVNPSENETKEKTRVLQNAKFHAPSAALCPFWWTKTPTKFYTCFQWTPAPGWQSPDMGHSTPMTTSLERKLLLLAT